MRRLTPLATALALACTVAGCAPAMHVSGQIDPGYRSSLVPGSRLHVAVNPEAPSHTLHNVLAGKIERLVTTKGFLVSSFEEADFLLLFDVGTVDRRRAEPGTWQSGVAGTELLDPDHYPWVHYLRISVTDGPRFRSGAGPLVVWAGWARLSNSQVENPRRPLELLDLFAIAALEHFPADTAGILTTRIAWNDRRAVELRQPD